MAAAADFCNRITKSTRRFLLRVHIFCGAAKAIAEVINVKKEEKQDEKKPISWEIADPKPPVIRSGHMEQRKEF